MTKPKTAPPSSEIEGDAVLYAKDVTGYVVDRMGELDAEEIDGHQFVRLVENALAMHFKRYAAARVEEAVRAERDAFIERLSGAKDSTSGNLKLLSERLLAWVQERSKP